ncbi:hypothetical protein [Emticicia agri]|uniref:Trimeric autotransporter adhesin YadA-like head domain-containing protein n=1 Tax=Emticicia agri TaxID=2492393 RepID=A0A4Q5M5C1_9BACT|nr:hypothetical protein [Emticicia agri]RYU97329.1 hypothetical protein EWM59_01160 [Emticicia agri]
MKYTFLIAWCCLFNTLVTKAQSSILLEPSKDNGIFSKRDSALNLQSNLPIILPASGAGTRLMWIPSLSAFRVGTVTGIYSADNWNADSIGRFSIAGGLNTKATGYCSIALGSSASATGNNSVALGVSSALGLDAIAMAGATAFGSNSVAAGMFSEAQGTFSVALGRGNISLGASSVALGSYAKANGDYSIAAGSGSHSFGESSITLGQGLTAYKYGGISMGTFNNPGNTTVTNYSDYSYSDRIFQLGNGVFDSLENAIIYSNALTVIRNGNVGIGNTVAALAPGERLVIDGNVSVVDAAKGIRLSANFSPLLTKTSDVFTSGAYQNLGRWGLFKDTDNFTFGIPAITNKTFRFVSYNDNSTISKTVLDINQNGNVSVEGFSKLGSSAPAIKVLKLTGTTAATQGTYTSIAHGLSLSKILSVEVFVSVSATVKHGRGWTAYGGHQFDFYIDSTVIQILNIAGNSSSILSKPYTVLITYEQ